MKKMDLVRQVSKLMVRRGGTLMETKRNYSASLFYAARHPHGRENKALVTDEFRKSSQNPWVAVQDPNGSPMVYYWNKETNETTALGAPKPQHWVSVKDPNGSALVYWWNPDTDETTALGAPKPTMAIQLQVQPQQLQVPPAQQVYSEPPRETLGSAMKSYFVMGVGMSLAFAMVRVMFG